jgi:RNA recognition motif-containing protein
MGSLAVGFVCSCAASPVQGWRFSTKPAAHSKGENEEMETKIYVGNLSYDTTEDDLRTLFAQAGTVASVALIKDRDTGQSKGFAFVEMSNQSEAEKAIQTFNGYTLANRPLKVNLARPREERGFGGGGYGDRRGGGGGGYGRGGPGGGGKSRRGPGGGQRRY